MDRVEGAPENADTHDERLPPGVRLCAVSLLA